METPIQKKFFSQANQIYIKRDDLYPVSFGGNKARKAVLFFQDLKKHGSSCIVTYGSAASNHCRVIANLAAREDYPCWIVTTSVEDEETANSHMVKLFGAQYIRSPVENVHGVIEQTIHSLQKQGNTPYFIPGGGHGNIGTQAYVDVYAEIVQWEQKHNIYFDYIFHASGTGTTQAGLICGQILSGDVKRQIVGISIARPLPRGREVVENSVRDYLYTIGRELPPCNLIHLEDAYICGGYGKINQQITDTIHRVLLEDGIPLCGTYTGKAFWGMEQYLGKKKIQGKNILYIHTGGTPLFFDDLRTL